MQGFGDSDFVLYMHDNVDSDVYMAFSNYRAALPSFYGNMLGWKQRTQYQSLFNTANAKGFWKSYYETEIREKYSIDTRILDCEMYLTGSDLATSTWGDIIRIDLQYYYLESVRDYYVGGKKASKVRLRRLLSSDSSGAIVGANCDLNIMTYDVDCFGVVTPFDRYGNEWFLMRLVAHNSVAVSGSLTKTPTFAHGRNMRRATKHRGWCASAIH